MGKQDIEYLKRLNDRERTLKFRLERADIETPNAVFIPDIKKELHAMEWGIEQIQSLTSRLKKAEQQRDVWLYELSEMWEFSKDSGDFVERFDPWLQEKLKEFDAKGGIKK